MKRLTVLSCLICFVLLMSGCSRGTDVALQAAERQNKVAEAIMSEYNTNLQEAKGVEQEIITFAVLLEESAALQGYKMFQSYDNYTYYLSELMIMNAYTDRLAMDVEEAKENLKGYAAGLADYEVHYYLRTETGAVVQEYRLVSDDMRELYYSVVWSQGTVSNITMQEVGGSYGFE